MSILGTRVIRTEDPRLLTSGGVYVDDLREPELAGAVRATFVRSTVAHALITGIDTSAALERAGRGRGADRGGHDRPAPPPPPEPVPDDAPPPRAPLPLGGVWPEPLLAVDRVRFVGEPVAIVLTDSTVPGRGRRRAGQRGLRAAARGGRRSTAALAGRAAAVPRRGHQRVACAAAAPSATTRSSTAATSSSRATSSTSGSPRCRWRAAATAAALRRTASSPSGRQHAERRSSPG